MVREPEIVVGAEKDRAPAVDGDLRLLGPVDRPEPPVEPGLPNPLEIPLEIEEGTFLPFVTVCLRSGTLLPGRKSYARE